MKGLKRLASAVPIVSLTYMAVAGEGAWGPWSSPSTPALVGAAYTDDDGGALLIACDKTKKSIGYVLREPRAHWEKGSQIAVTTRADDGSQTGPSKGIAINSTSLAVGDEAASDISAMGKGKVNFEIGAGGYTRVFPASNFKAALEPVLRTCGDS